MKRLNEALLDAFYALGLSRYTSGRVEYAQTQGKMRANRAAHERYARAFYPVWNHPEMLRQLWAARSAFFNNPCEDTLDVLCHVQYNLWHTDFVETYEQADTGTLNLSDPFIGLRKVVESERHTLKRWTEVKERNPQAQVGKWIDGRNISVSVDEMIEDAEEDVAIAEGQLAEALGEKVTAAHLAEALGEKVTAAVRDLRREEPLPAPVAPPPKPAWEPAHAAAGRYPGGCGSGRAIRARESDRQGDADVSGRVDEARAPAAQGATAARGHAEHNALRAQQGMGRTEGRRRANVDEFSEPDRAGIP